MSEANSSIEVPAFTPTILAPRSHRYACLVFVLNEGQRILRQLEAMRPFADRVDIVIADGGSTDGGVAVSTLSNQGVRALLVKTGPGRLSAQMRMALFWALEQGYDGMITMDGNNKDDPAAIPRFVEALENGYDHIQGSRFIPGGKAVRTPLSRMLGIKLLHAPAIRLAAGYPYTDTTNGFRAYSRKLLEDPRVEPFRSVFSAYELHYYLAIRAARLGHRVIEIPVTRTYPMKGKTPTKISPISGNLEVLRTLVRACLHKFDPPSRHSAAPERR